MTDKDNEHEVGSFRDDMGYKIVPEYWSKEIEDQLSVNNIVDVFGVSTEMLASRKRTIKEKIYWNAADYVFRFYIWLEEKYWKERNK